MKIMFYALRPFDEQQYCEPYKARYGIDYTGTPDVPRPDNLHLAEGCDAVSTNPCEIRPEYLQTWAEMGVKYLPCRSIGYDHIPLDTAKKLGLRISHSHYPPDGVANYTIMLMLMCTRRMNEIMLRANVQDYSLPGKMGRDISGCTVGVIGTGKIGQTVIRHLSGFGCKILAYDLYPNDAVRQYADLSLIHICPPSTPPTLTPSCWMTPIPRSCAPGSAPSRCPRPSLPRPRCWRSRVCPSATARTSTPCPT